MRIRLLVGLALLGVSVSRAAAQYPETVRAFARPDELADAVAIAKLVGQTLRTDHPTIGSHGLVVLEANCPERSYCAGVAIETRAPIMRAFAAATRLSPFELGLNQLQTAIHASLPQMMADGTISVSVRFAAKAGGGGISYSVRKATDGTWEVFDRSRWVY
jgi:hypothetical protein